MTVILIRMFFYSIIYTEHGALKVCEMEKKASNRDTEKLVVSAATEYFKEFLNFKIAEPHIKDTKSKSHLEKFNPPPSSDKFILNE